jgi:cytochrome c-type biogenesis protein CcmH/NrfG
LNTFWILALIIGLIATVVIVVPMLHAHFVKGAKDTSPGATIGIGIAVALSVPISAVIMYNNWTSWDSNASQAQAQQEDMAHSMEEAIVGLEARLARDQPV